MERISRFEGPIFSLFPHTIRIIPDGFKGTVIDLAVNIIGSYPLEDKQGEVHLYFFEAKGVSWVCICGTQKQDCLPFPEYSLFGGNIFYQVEQIKTLIDHAPQALASFNRYAEDIGLTPRGFQKIILNCLSTYNEEEEQ